MNSPDIVFLMETKNDESMVLKELEFLNMTKFCIVPPHSPGGGGLFLGWKDEVDVVILSKNDNCIDTKVTHKGVSFHASFIYGEPDQSKRHAVWNTITELPN